MLITKDEDKAMTLCLAAGLAKELYDEYDYGGFDEKDLLADYVGCLIGTKTNSCYIHPGVETKFVCSFKLN